MACAYCPECGEGISLRNLRVGIEMFCLHREAEKVTRCCNGVFKESHNSPPPETFLIAFFPAIYTLAR